VNAPLRRVAVYCGANRGARPAYPEAAAALGRLLAQRGIGVVFGGGQVGLMGALADAALAAGGDVIGVIPESLRLRELAHPAVTRMHVVAGMHERKALIADLSDAFIALPGGLGTLDELFEVLTWTQLGHHAKPCGLLDVLDYWAPLVALLDHAAAEGFLRAEHRELLFVETDPSRLLDRFAAAAAAVPAAGAPPDLR
jgi:hypothetical protein